VSTVLRAAIEAAIEGVGLRQLHRAVETLSSVYRSRESGPVGALDDLQRLAYIAVRLPATYAAVSKVLRETARALEPHEVVSLLDLGAGPGTTLWAAADAFPSLVRATSIDCDRQLLDYGARLWQRHARAGSIQARWQTMRLDMPGTLAEADLIVLAYALGELPAQAAHRLVQRAYEAARVAVVIVEPGTPRGYRNVIEARDRLVADGASIAAPCPHAGPCPLTGADWCHFAVRLERSRVHRQLKGAELAWEDEKYSYVVAAKTPAASTPARILRHPIVEKGRIALRLCAASGGVEDVTITRRDKDLWRSARDARWGGRWDVGRRRTRVDEEAHQVGTDGQTQK
jgi:ribosomal protein RSM22 (predicted rRNA methylase)